MISLPPGTEMFQFPGFALTPYEFRCQCTGSTPVRVAPFGNPRIKGCLLLPEAYRSWPRPSSLPGAKASALCPFCLTCRSTVNPEKPSTLISGLSSKIAKINYQRASPVMNRRQSLKKRLPPIHQTVVEDIGVEPTTSCLQGRRSPN